MKSSRWMKWVVLVLSLLVIIPTMAFAQAGGGSGGGGNGNGGGGVNGRGGSATFRANNPMPVLIYTVWGLGGGTSVSATSDVSTLVIYDNGIATWSQSNADGTNASGCSGNCLDTIQLSTSQINQLMAQLRAAGAFRLISNNPSPTSSDTTLSTITIFRSTQGSTSVAQTFSFYDSRAQGRLAAIQNVFGNFFSTNFGSSSINGSGGSGNGG
jgi:hypothetical protein